MDSLIVHPTQVAQWQALIHEAQGSCSVHLNEDLESYLVFLLMRYVVKPDMVASIMALEFLEGLNVGGRMQRDRLQDVGDKCLLLAGLFPGRAQRRRVRISYYVGLGQGAYGVLSDNRRQQKLAALFASLREGFVNLMDVLQATRSLSGNSQFLTPIEAAELWSDTGSQQAYQRLRASSDVLSFPIKNDDEDSCH